MNHNNVSHEIPFNTVGDETQAFPVTLNHPDNGLQTVQVQDPDFIHVPSQVVTPPPSPILVAQPVPAPPQPFMCPGCERGFRRWQDRDRHICTHLPYSYFCPFPHCPWRSGRPENVTRHWNDIHSEYGPVPSRQQMQIYYSKGLVAAIVDGALTVDDAAELALSVVAIKTVELDKGDVWQNGWGRRTMTGQ